MSITIQPVGGLGNQLFIYATGVALASKLSTNLNVDVSHFETNLNRDFQLDQFRSRIATVFSSTEPPKKTNGAIGLLRKIIGSRLGESHPAVVKDRGFWFDPRILDAPDGSKLDGYLQSWKYFHSDAAAIRNEVQDILSPTNWFTSTQESLAARSPWIGVHVRRGDYVTVERMGLATDYYYSRSIRLIQDLTGIRDVIVFSDDIKAARSLPSLNKEQNTIFVESAQESSPLENLLLLSQAHHLVMANSSFSWWAAWLRDDEQRRVVYPRPWIDFRLINDRDLPLPHWIGMGREPLEDALQNHVGY